MKVYMIKHMNTKQSPSDVAKAMKDMAKATGFTITARGSVCTVRKQFTPGDKDAYTMAECDANSILGMLRMVEPGSVWGTDGASVGGYVGLTHGYMELHKSGGSKRVMSALAKG